MNTEFEYKTENRLFDHNMVNVIKTETVFDKDGMVIEKHYVDKPLYVVLRHEEKLIDRKYVTKVTKSRPVLENIKTDGLFTSNCYCVCKMNGKYINSFCANADFYTYKRCKYYRYGIMDRLIKSNVILKMGAFRLLLTTHDKKYKDEEICAVDFFSSGDLTEVKTYTKKEKEKLLLQKQNHFNALLAELETTKTEIKELQKELYVERKTK